MNVNMPPAKTIIFIHIIISFLYEAKGSNLSCYQCVKTSPEPCAQEDLLPCPGNKDRCVTHISKDPVNGYRIKRECGLYPCYFDEAIVNRGLGLDVCDTQKDDVFCLFCCKENACNSSVTSNYDWYLILLAILVSTLGAISALRYADESPKTRLIAFIVIAIITFLLISIALAVIVGFVLFSDKHAQKSRGEEIYRSSVSRY